MFTHTQYHFTAITAGDAAYTYRLRSSNYGESSMLMLSPRPTTVEREILWIQQMPENTGKVYFLIREARTHEPCGYIFLSAIDPIHRRADVGVLVDPDHRGKGVGRAAVTFMVDYGVKHLNLRKFYAHILVRNKASVQLFTRCGFKREGCLKGHHFTFGRYEDVLLMGCAPK